MPQIVTPSVIRALNVALTNTFNTRLEAEPEGDFFRRLVMETESTGAYADYAWLTSIGAVMREWIGEREVQEGVLIDQYLIRNRKFELTVRVPIEDIEDGTYAFKAQVQAQDRADAYNRRRHDLIVDLVLSSLGAEADPNDPDTWFQVGTQLLGPDGVPFFAVNHPFGTIAKRVRANGTETVLFEQEGEWSNLSTAAFSKDALKDARRVLRMQKDHYGRPARLRPNVLVVGPMNEDLAVEAVTPSRITKIETDGDGAEVRTEMQNPLGSAFDVIVLDELGDSPAWGLFDDTRVVKPFIFQNRVRPQFQRTNTVSADAAEGLVDPITFMQDAILFGVRARFGAGYGNPRLGFWSVGTDDSLAGDMLG